MLPSQGILMAESIPVPRQKPAPPDRVEEVQKLLRAAGFGDAAVAGIMGNIHVETGGTFDSRKRQDNNGPGRGLFQMEPGTGKLDEYQIWLDQTGRGDTSDNQIKFFKDTIYSPAEMESIVGRDVAGHGDARKLRKIMDSDDPEMISRRVSELWEKPGTPHMDRRLEATNRYYQENLPPLASDLVASAPVNNIEEPEEPNGIRNLISNILGSFRNNNDTASFDTSESRSTLSERRFSPKDEAQFQNLMQRLKE